MGHPENMFVDFEGVSSKLKCPVCFLVLKEAVFHLHCQTGFCKGCLAKVKVCPCCRRSIKEGVFNDITRRELVLELMVMCGETRECDWVGTLEAYHYHQKQCKESMAVVACQGCGVSYRKKEAAAHQACFVKCAHCGVDVKLADCDTHSTECEGAITRCCNKGCSAQLPKNELEAHFEECEFMLMWCPYYQFGCRARVRRCDAESHRRGCGWQERNPLAERCRLLEDTIADLKGKLASSFEVLDMTLMQDFVVRKVHGDEVGRLVWKVPHFIAKTARFLESKTFFDSVGDEWTCRMYPSGDGNTQGFVTFGAYKTTDSVAKYTVEIVHPTNPTQTIIRSIAPTDTRWRVAGWGWRRLISRERILKQNYLDSKGTLTFIITVKASDYILREGC
eukprot:TRINITY_DN34460_c0_g1_i1.p1 TRINITY_DN34460_c0_g1~~TRINITY_DN34460_c0_g1_i1.p1  ORF type:complete len:392 (+),score=135.07 TRINITY_DN34460_c0_g1_i1:56-1231(+)